MTPQRTQGFTLVELLVAIALFGVLLAVLIPSITALLGINRSSERQLSSTTVAQRVVEDIKGAWQLTPLASDTQGKAVRGRFYAGCVPGLALPAGASAQSQERDSRAGAISGKGLSTVASTCPSTLPTDGPVMRRVVVRAGTGTPQEVTLTLDLLEPQ